MPESSKTPASAGDALGEDNNPPSNTVDESLSGSSIEELENRRVEITTEVQAQFESIDAGETELDDETLALVEMLSDEDDAIDAELADRRSKAEREAQMRLKFSKEDGEPSVEEPTSEDSSDEDQSDEENEVDSSEELSSDDATNTSEPVEDKPVEDPTNESEELSTDDDTADDSGSEGETDVTDKEELSDNDEDNTEDQASTDLVVIDGNEKTENTTEDKPVSDETKTPDTEGFSMSRAPEAPAVVSPNTGGGTELAIRPLQATINAAGNNAGYEFGSMHEVAKAVMDKQAAFGSHGGTQGSERISIATSHAEYPDEVNLTKDHEVNYDVMNLAGSRHTRNITDHSRNPDSLRFGADQATNAALVASGGTCAPFAPIYNIWRTAVPQNPVESALPVVQAPRGGIRYICPPDFRDAFGAIGLTSCCDDAAGYVSTPAECGGPGPTPDKPCVCIECPPVKECCVTAISQCVRIGNLNFRTFPEQIEAFLADVAVAFTAAKEVMYLDAIHEGSVKVPEQNIPDYGLSKSLFWQVVVAASNYRRSLRMSPDATLQWLAPSWVLDALRIDLYNNPECCGTTPTEGDVLQLFRNENLEPTFYYDSPTGLNQEFMDPLCDGQPLNNFPDTALWYLFAPGTWVILDSGDLDLGIVRDSELIKTNDMIMFMEEWRGICKVGCLSICVESTICPSGAGPAPVTPACQIA